MEYLRYYHKKRRQHCATVSIFGHSSKLFQTSHCFLGAKLAFATKSPFYKGGFRVNVNTWSFFQAFSNLALSPWSKTCFCD